MADLNEPKKETVRVTLPPRPAKTPGGGDSRDTVRIKLPVRPPSSSFPARPEAVPPKPPPPPPAPSVFRRGWPRRQLRHCPAAAAASIQAVPAASAGCAVCQRD